jgi:hypothetical protein
VDVGGGGWTINILFMKVHPFAVDAESAAFPQWASGIFPPSFS